MSKNMQFRASEVIAVIPAAGLGTRMPDRGSSKEMLPVYAQRKCGESQLTAEPVIAYLLASLRQAGVTEARIVLRKGKWDIPDYLAGTDWDDMAFVYTITRGTSGVPESVALGLRDAPERNVVFGFPDILFEPASAFSHLIERLQKNLPDVVLGLFPTENPAKMDMVKTEADGSVTAIDVKPAKTALDFAWILAAWRPTFTKYFLELVANAPERFAAQAMTNNDIHLGHAFQLALEDGLSIEAESFVQGRSLDIGTPEDLKLAQVWLSQATSN